MGVKDCVVITVNIRKQGGAAVMTIPADVLKLLDTEVGAALELDVRDGMFVARPLRAVSKKRYSLAELLKGATPARLAALNAQTEWARSGQSVGREIG